MVSTGRREVISIPLSRAGGTSRSPSCPAAPQMQPHAAASLSGSGYLATVTQTSAALCLVCVFSVLLIDVQTTEKKGMTCQVGRHKKITLRPDHTQERTGNRRAPPPRLPGPETAGAVRRPEPSPRQAPGARPSRLMQPSITPAATARGKRRQGDQGPGCTPPVGTTGLLFQEVLLGPDDGAGPADPDPGDDLGVREPVVLHDVAGDQRPRPAQAGCKRGTSRGCQPARTCPGTACLNATDPVSSDEGRGGGLLAPEAGPPPDPKDLTRHQRARKE